MMAIYMFNALQESAKAELRLSDFDMSLIQGTAIAVPLSLFAIPFGALADRTNRMRLLIVMMLVLAVSTAATAYAPSLWLMFAARVVAATAASAILTIVISLAADFSAMIHRGRAMLVVNVGKILGTAAAFAIGAALTTHFSTSGVPRWFATTEPWRASYITIALTAVGFALVLLPLGEPARPETLAGPDAPSQGSRPRSGSAAPTFCRC
jgi:MFS family permease